MAELNRRDVMVALFCCFGQSDDVNRMLIYLKELQDIPTVELSLVCKKVMNECRRLPSLCDIREAYRSLYEHTHETERSKLWQEAWQEIEARMHDTQWGHKPKWSTKEISTAVDTFGWETLHTISSNDMNTARAQIRRFYEDACERSKTVRLNEAILGNNSQLLQASSMIKQIK